MAAPVLVIVAALAAALALAGWLAHRLGMPPSLGYLAVGIAISPALAGRIGIPFDAITDSTHIAVLVLLFFIGLELDLKRLQQVIRSTAGTTLLNIAVPAVLVTGLASALGWSLVEALALGITVSVSSTIFGDRLSSMPGFSQDSRRRMLGILLGEDVGAGALLAILVLLGGSAAGGGWLAPLATMGRLVFLLVLMTAGALLVVPRMLDAVARTRVPELLVLAGALVIVAFGALGAWAGSAELGALVAGVAAAEAGARFSLRGSLAPLRDVGLAIFFLGSGMGVDAALVADEWALAVLVAGTFLFSMVVVNVPTSIAAGQSPADAVRTALGLGTLGEFSLILVAAAQANGVGHPALAGVVIGAMVLLLAVTPLLLQAVPLLVRLGHRLPRGIRQSMQLLVQTQRKKPARSGSTVERRNASFLLASNLILLLAWASLSAGLGPRIVDRFAPDYGILVPILIFAVAIAAAAPLVQRAYRAYRDLVWLLVGLRPGESSLDGAGRVRARLVDAWVAATTVLLLVPVALVVPSTLPVLLGGIFVAVAIIAVAWRRLSRFQRALESTVTRVLGHDPKTALLLDQVLQRYPWGVRFAAGTVAAESPVAGRTISESRLPELTGALVAVLERGGRETVNPPAGTRLLAGDSVVLMGTPEELTKAEALLVAHGKALRTSAQSRLAQIVEVPVEVGSPLVGRTLGQSDLRGQTGALVVGLWHHGAAHPEPFRPDLVVHADDHLILLGSPLQVDRARHFASNGSSPPLADAA
ncbi:MAG: cation:proton antiporter [Candidatus Thermoplasmatota archaeon]